MDMWYASLCPSSPTISFLKRQGTSATCSTPLSQQQLSSSIKIDYQSKTIAQHQILVG